MRTLPIAYTAVLNHSRHPLLSHSFVLLSALRNLLFTTVPTDSSRAIMADRYRGWTDEQFTLLVGPEKTELRVSQGVLELLPFFKNALQRYVNATGYRPSFELYAAYKLTDKFDSGGFTESKTKTFELPDDDPKPVADLLYYAYSDQVQPIPRAAEGTFSLSRKALDDISVYVEAWVLADKYSSEVTANRLVDAIIQYGTHETIHPALLAVLGGRELRDTPLYNLLAQEIWAEWKAGHYDNFDFDKDTSNNDPDEWSTLEQVLEFLPQQDMIRLFTSGRQYLLDEQNREDDDGYDGPYPMTYAMRELCKYHKHELTPPCQKQDKTPIDLTGDI